jgi:hypothetical protein
MIGEYPIGTRGTVKALPCVPTRFWLREFVIVEGLAKRFVVYPDQSTGYEVVYIVDIDGATPMAGTDQLGSRHEQLLPYPPPEERRSEMFDESHLPYHSNCRCVIDPIELRLLIAQHESKAQLAYAEHLLHLAQLGKFK